MKSASRGKWQRPTMQAIAARARVSRATVSIVLNNPELAATRFKPETIERIHDIAEEMGYHINLMATSLKSSPPTFFAMILRGIAEEDAISWHHQAFEGQFEAGVVRAAMTRKLYPVLATQAAVYGGEMRERVCHALDGGVFAGLARTPLPELREPIRRRIERGFPIIVVFPDESQDYPVNTIDLDNRVAGEMAAELLRDAGRRRWLIVRDGMDREALRRRTEGVLAVAEAAEASVEVLLLPRGVKEGEIISLLIPRLRELRPDGVYAASSVAGVGALLACQAAGLRVPEDTSLVGCDASLWRAPGCPPITSIDVSWHAVGELALQRMVELSASDAPTCDNLYVPPTIRRGGTCPGGEDEPPQVVSYPL